MSLRSFSDAMRLLESLKPPDDQPKARKQARIVEAATTLFLRHGYRKTSMDDVAAHAGVAKGTLYLYFKTKSDLLVQAIVAEKLRSMEAFREIFDEKLPARERLKRMLKGTFLMIANMPLAARLTSGDRDFIAALHEIDPAIMKQSETIGLEWLTDLIMRACGRRKPTPDLLDRARVLRGLLFFASLLSSEPARHGLSLEQHAEVLADLLVDGVAPAEKEK